MGLSAAFVSNTMVSGLGALGLRVSFYIHGLVLQGLAPAPLGLQGLAVLRAGRLLDSGHQLLQPSAGLMVKAKRCSRWQF